MAPTNGVKTRSRDLLANRRSAMTTTTTKTTMTTTKTLTALALAATALTVMVGPSEAAPRLAAGLSGLHVTGPFHEVPPFISPPARAPKISCFACNLPHGGQGGARPPGYGWGYGNHWPYHGWGYGNHWPDHGWGYGDHWPYRGWGYGYGNHWGYGYYNWYRWHPAYYGGAPVAAEPVAAAPVATAAAPAAPIGGCNCLTKQMLPNGAELLQDVCTQRSAVAQPQS
jgi:hypothetical protein